MSALVRKTLERCDRSLGCCGESRRPLPLVGCKCLDRGGSGVHQLGDVPQPLTLVA